MRGWIDETIAQQHRAREEAQARLADELLRTEHDEETERRAAEFAARLGASGADLKHGELVQLATINGELSLAPGPRDYIKLGARLAAQFRHLRPGDDLADAPNAWRREITKEFGGIHGIQRAGQRALAIIDHRSQVECGISIAGLSETANKYKLHNPFQFAPASGRAACPLYWRRQVRTVARQARATLDILSRDAAPYKYSSGRAIIERQEQLKNNAELLLKRNLINENGDIINLGELAGRARKGRAAELAHRAWSIGNLAENEGLWPFLLTITCPSRFHPVSRKYDNTPPVEAGKYLSRQFKKFQDSLSKRYSRKQNAGIPAYFFRVAECHGDECPHFHIIVWIRKEDEGQVLDAAKKYFLNNIDGNEPGAAKKRIKFEQIKPHALDNPSIKEANRAAISYACKYILKNISNEDFTDKSGGVYSSAAVDAWRARWGIRAFGFGAFHTRAGQITIWRELRRRGVLTDAGGYINKLKEAATTPDYSEFCRIANEIRNSGLRLGILRSEKKENKYGETVDGDTLGVRIFEKLEGGCFINHEQVITRRQSWRAAVQEKDGSWRAGDDQPCTKMVQQEVIVKEPRGKRENEELEFFDEKMKRWERESAETGPPGPTPTDQHANSDDAAPRRRMQHVMQHVQQLENEVLHLIFADAA